MANSLKFEVYEYDSANQIQLALNDPKLYRTGSYSNNYQAQEEGWYPYQIMAIDRRYAIIWCKDVIDG